jgi:hypothetical protein
MDQLDGFVTKGREEMVCKLVKSLYGHKQSPKKWYEKFNRTLTLVRFVANVLVAFACLQIYQKARPTMQQLYQAHSQTKVAQQTSRSIFTKSYYRICMNSVAT